MDEEDDVVGPLPYQLGVLDGAGLSAQDSQRLVADLPAMAVRAVQQVAAPALVDPRHVRQLVADTGGDQDPSRSEDGAAGEADEESRLDAEHPVLDQVDAVARHLGPAGFQQLPGGHPVAGQEALHVRRRCVARRAALAAVGPGSGMPGRSAR